MPVAFLYNRKAEGSYDVSLADALDGSGYVMVSACHEMFIMEREFDVAQGLRADNSVGIIAADVEARGESGTGSFPQQISRLNAVADSYFYHTDSPYL